MVTDKVVELEACATQTVRRTSPSPPSWALTCQASQDAAAGPEEDVDREDSDTRNVVQTLLNQLLLQPPPLFPGRHRRIAA